MVLYMVVFMKVMPHFMQRVTWLLQEFSPSSAENVLDCDLVHSSVLRLENIQVLFFSDIFRMVCHTDFLKFS